MASMVFVQGERITLFIASWSAIVRTVPRGVRGSRVPVRSSADTGEGFGKVINQRPETPSVPSICRGPSGGDLKFRPKGSRPEYGVRRSEVGDWTEREGERIKG